MCVTAAVQVLPSLVTREGDLQVVYKDADKDGALIVMMSTAGPITAPKLANGHVG